MQANIAVGLLALSSIAKGIESADAMCKMASVTLVKTSVIARGKYTVLISGPVGEVESSLRAGREIAGKALIDEVIIRNVHSGVLAALETRIPVDKIEALGIIETREAVSAVRAADAAAKAAQVASSRSAPRSGRQGPRDPLGEPGRWLGRPRHLHLPEDAGPRSSRWILNCLDL